jgi:hypothetical protein
MTLFLDKLIEPVDVAGLGEHLPTPTVTIDGVEVPLTYGSALAVILGHVTPDDTVETRTMMWDLMLKASLARKAGADVVNGATLTLTTKEAAFLLGRVEMFGMPLLIGRFREVIGQ